MLTDSFAGAQRSEAEIPAARQAMLAEIMWQDRPWWEYYEDDELNLLIVSALDDNPTINQMRSRLEQAAAAARVSMADLVPDLTVSGARETSNGDDASPSSFTLRGAAGYELDVWGGNKAEFQSDKLQAQAAAEDVRAAVITLSASIIESWLNLLTLREEEALLRSQIETNEMVLDLQHKRYENGVAQALDVLQQKEVLERARAQLPDVLAQQELVQHQLALLAGRNPSAPLPLERGQLPETLPLPDTGIPARLLAARPDVGAAWLRLVAADWASEAARVERLPNFDISTAYATDSAKFGGLFETWALNLALGLVMPIFDGGARAAEQARQEAIADERFQLYRETVLGAIGEVEDALSLNYYQMRRIEAVEEQLRTSRNALEQAQISYSNGNADYISVLNGLVNVQSLEQQLVRERRDLALERVELYRALGLRTWTDNIIETNGESRD